MKKLLSGLIVAMSLVWGATASMAADEVNWSVLPTDEAALTALDTEQMRAVRTAVRHCEDFARSNHQLTPCVFTDVDRVMRQSENAALRAYHFALPRGMRYDDKRHSGFAVKQVLEQRQKYVQ